MLTTNGFVGSSRSGTDISDGDEKEKEDQLFGKIVHIEDDDCEF